LGHSFAYALVGDILYNVGFYRTLRMSFFVATTIGRANMMAILEVEENEEPQKGEVKLSRDCVKKNIESGLFKDITHSVQNAIGKVYVLASDLQNN